VAAGRRSDALIGQQDLFATGADLVGTPPPETAAEDSVSFLPALLDAAAAGRTTIVNHSAEGRFAIREGNWKLLLWPGSGGWSSPTPAPSRWLKVDASDLSQLPPYQLFDLGTDPAEQRNVAADHPDVVLRLGRRLRDEILRGRSTPGAAEPVSIKDAWPQTRWISEFVLP
jgi:arylsulfatase A-like enzyme